MATRLANRHGLCSNEINIMVEWVPRAVQRGLIDGPAAGLDPAAYGSSEWITNLIEAVVQRRGIGDLLAEGSRRATEALGCTDLLDGLATAAGFHANLYSPQLFLSAAPIYATEPIHPITQLHGISFPMVKWMIWLGTDGMMSTFSTDSLRQLARTFWGGEAAAQFDTPEGMGRAAKIMQDRAYAKENLIGCDFFWPIDYSGNSETGVGDPGLEARLFSAVTGWDIDENAYLRTGERCQNLCRAIYLREGRQGRVGRYSGGIQLYPTAGKTRFCSRNFQPRGPAARPRRTVLRAGSHGFARRLLNRHGRILQGARLGSGQRPANSRGSCRS